MQHRIVSFCILTVFLSTVTVALAQEPVTPEPKDRAAHEEHVSQVKDIVSYVRASNAKEDVRAVALASLGRMLYHDDPDYSKALFTEALDYIYANLPDAEAREAQQAARKDIIRTIARADIQLAKDELKKLDQVDRGLYAAIGESLLKENSTVATEMLFRAVEGKLDQSTYFRLQVWRSINAEATDKVFLYIVRRSQAQGISQQDFLSLGWYLFTSSHVPPGTIGIWKTNIGGVQVDDLTVDRQDMQPALIQEYLVLGRKVLLAPAGDPGQQRQNFAIATMMLPRVRKLTPELERDYIGALGSNQGSGEVRDQADNALNKLKSPPSFEQLLKAADDTKDPVQKDVNYLNLAFKQWRENNFEQVDLLAEKKMSNPQVSKQLQYLSKYGKSTLAAKKGDWETAERDAAELPPLSSAMAWLFVGRQRASKGETSAARLAVEQGIKAAEKLEGPQKPYLLRDAAGQLLETAAEPGKERAQSVFVQSITALNAEGYKPLIEFTEPVSFPGQSGATPFILDTKVVLKGSFSEVLPGFVKLDPPGVIYRLKEIENKEAKVKALVVAAEQLLKLK